MSRLIGKALNLRESENQCKKKDEVFIKCDQIQAFSELLSCIKSIQRETFIQRQPQLTGSFII